MNMCNTELFVNQRMRKKSDDNDNDDDDEYQLHHSFKCTQTHLLVYNINITYYNIRRKNKNHCNE